MTTLTAPYLDLVEQAMLAAGESAPDTIEQLVTLPKIKVFTDALKAQEVNGQRIFRCTASSTIKDLHGDYMTEDCVRDMAQQAKKGPTNNGLTIFLNHRYSVPEDVAGKVIDTQTLTRSKDGDGGDVWDMDYVVQLATGSERINQTWNLIANDQITLGISIGAYILEYDFVDKDAGFWGGLIINKVLLVETSIVGIPANQRSWIQNGVISIGKSLGFDEKQIRRVLDRKEAPPVMSKTLTDAAAAAALIDNTNFVITSTTTTTPNIVLSATPVVLTSDDTSAESTDDAPEVTADAAPETESTDEQPTEANPDETAGETTEDVTASDDPALEAAAEVALSKTAGTEPAVELVLAALETATAQVKDLRTEKAALEDQIKALTGERDQAIKDRDFAAEIIETIAKSPLGRKTGFREPVASFSQRFAGIYDQGFLKLFDSNESE